MVFGSGAMQEAHRRWFERWLPGGGVQYRNATDEWHGIAISGPRSRELLSALVREDVSNAALPFMAIRRGFVAGVPAILARISFSGELGYEIYVPPAYQLRLAEAVEEAGAALGLRWYGARALMSLRLEKGWGVWTLDYRPDFTPAESGLDAFIRWDKDFIGREAALAARGSVPARRLVVLTVESDVDVCGDEAILAGDQAVGYVSSGGYAHHAARSVAFGYVASAYAAAGRVLAIEISGTRRAATVLGEPLHDPSGARMRS